MTFKKSILLLTSFLLAIPALAQVQLGGHVYVPSTTDSNGGFSYLSVTASGTCNLLTAASSPTNGCGLYKDIYGTPTGPDGPWNQTLEILNSTTNSTVVYMPCSDGRTWTINDVQDSTNGMTMQAYNVSTSTPYGAAVSFADNGSTILWCTKDGLDTISTPNYIYIDQRNSNVGVSTTPESPNGGAYNSGLGFNVLSIVSGAANVAMGYGALSAETAGARDVALGSEAMYYTTTGSESVAIGYNAGQQINSNFNVAIGQLAMYGLNGTITGTNNTAIGSGTLSAVTTGHDNTALGYGALAVTNAITTGYDNIGIGSGADLQSPTDNNEIVIGYSQNGYGSNTVTLGDSTTIASYLFGITVPGTIYSASGTALPSCASGIKGASATVSDATAPLYMTAYTSGGAVTAEVICSYNGTTYAWLTH